MKVIFIGPEKGGIVAEAGTEAGIRGIKPFTEQVPGVEQAFFGDVFSYGAAGFFLEGVHQVIPAHIEFICQFINTYTVC